MAEFAHGLVLGKFYPPHTGHHALVRSASMRCERVTVVVLGASVESISIAARVEWLTAEHASDGNVDVVGALDDYPIDFQDPDIWKAHVDLTAAAVARRVVLAGEPAQNAAVDAVFTSETYGDELARRFGAVHVCVDLGRIGPNASSGTVVRADTVGHWDRLGSAARGGLALRAVFVGAESSGTTTVSLKVAEALRARGGVWADTQWVEEYGRAYTAGRLSAATVQAERADDGTPGMDDLLWSPEDFVEIAYRQQFLEDMAARRGGPVLVCDTDAFATGIWQERYLGFRSPEVDAVASAVPHPLYLVTSHEGVPFEQDGMRDGEHLRAWMTNRFVERLNETGRRWVMLEGELTQRIATALETIDEIAQSYWRYAPPLPERVRERSGGSSD